MIDITAACPFCGQMRMVQIPDDIPEECRDAAAQSEAILCCDCREGESARQRYRIMSIAQENIEGMFRNKYPDIADLLLQAVEMIYERTVKKITVTEPGGGVASMHFSKSGIVVEWRVTKKQEAATGL